ncbi:MAG: hypothetical protein WCG25_01225 [bacterium]
MSNIRSFFWSSKTFIFQSSSSCIFHCFENCIILPVSFVNLDEI